ncbi:MAG: SUMF1/EgtB/PvdO family nonheme iron enzyme, partial [Deltaproteobacteria bacterium]|nr:SUMF1/EgtB/PvdO family nonheme iron enzyme [Deltaproteobacteria bacterium]
AGGGEDRVVLVDFGLARLRAADRPSESAGGTPAYMAPEQLHEGRVDARSDLFSAALVLVFLLTGWRRPNAFTIVPPLDGIEDPHLRGVLLRALDKNPEKRFPTARALAAALTGKAAAAAPPSQPTQILLPFRHLAALTEADRGRLYGRETDLAMLTEHALYRRSVIYTAPSGVGKTSLLRAGLLPRLEALGVRAVYQRCRRNFAAALANAISEGVDSIEEAIAAWHANPRRAARLVIVLDQLETALADADFVPSVLAFDRWPAGADVAVILSIREDYLARLVARTQELEPGMPIVRLPPLSPDGARAAIAGPLAQCRLGIEPELLDALLEDLQTAAAAIGPEMGWGRLRVVFPPHLQLACSVLYEALAPGEATITLAHYRRLGGFDAIVGEHLDRVIETELADGRDKIAREIFVALVTAHHERAMRPEAELVETAGAAPHEVAAVLEILRSRGLLVRVRMDGNVAGWELVHDSLVKRVLAWIDRHDLARRRALELVRYHLRRSRPDAPSLLGRGELRELRAYPTVVAELDEEWKKRPDEPWTPSGLVAASRQALRRRRIVLASTLGAAFAFASVGMYGRHVAGQRAREQEDRAEAIARDREREAAALASLRDRNLGRFELSIEGFDWDPAAQRATPVALPEVRWALHQPDRADDRSAGAPFEPRWIERGPRRLEGTRVVEQLEAHGGAAFLVVERGACRPSVIPLKQLPGFAERDRENPRYEVRVPTCAASRAGTSEVPAGTFIFRGFGDPVAEIFFLGGYDYFLEASHEERVDLPRFAMDTTEVTNAAYGTLAGMAAITGIAPPLYAGTATTVDAALPAVPVSFVDWFEARAYCRFHGKELPTIEQWTKAMRGGEVLPDGRPNPNPRRNNPWGDDRRPIPAHIQAPGPAVVGTHPEDVSVYGILDLGGNVMEWTATPGDDPGFVFARGANYIDTRRDEFDLYIPLDNKRAPRSLQFGLGFRCTGA